MTYLRRDTYHTSRAQAEMDELCEAAQAHAMRPHDAYEQIQAAAALGVLDKLPEAGELPLMCPSTQKT